MEWVRRDICLVLVSSSQSGRGREKRQVGDRTAEPTLAALRCSKDRMAHTRLASALWGLSQCVQVASFHFLLSSSSGPDSQAATFL